MRLISNYRDPKSGEMSQAEWNIKVNQQVPWEMDQHANNRQTTHSNPNSLNSSTTHFGQSMTSAAISLSMSMSNPDTMTNLLQPKNPYQLQSQQQQPQQPQQQQPQQSIASQISSHKSQVDTGTDIWLSNSGKAKPAMPMSNWEGASSQQTSASNNSSNSQSSSSSPITTSTSNNNHINSQNQNWSSNNNNSNTQWNTNNGNGNGNHNYYYLFQICTYKGDNYLVKKYNIFKI